jgi:hypothetical protein
LGASAFPFFKVPYPKEPKTPLKKGFRAFLNTQISEYKLSSFSEQVTAGFRVPGSEEPLEVQVLGFSDS